MKVRTEHHKKKAVQLKVVDSDTHHENGSKINSPAIFFKTPKFRQNFAAVSTHTGPAIQLIASAVIGPIHLRPKPKRLRRTFFSPKFLVRGKKIRNSCFSSNSVFGDRTRARSFSDEAGSGHGLQIWRRRRRQRSRDNDTIMASSSSSSKIKQNSHLLKKKTTPEFWNVLCHLRTWLFVQLFRSGGSIIY